MKQPDPSPVAPDQIITKWNKALVVRVGDVVFFDPEIQDFVLNRKTPHPCGIEKWVFNIEGLNPNLRRTESSYFGWTIQELVEVWERPEEFLP